MIVGRGGHYRQLMLEGCNPEANLIAIGHCGDREMEARNHTRVYGCGFDVFVSASAQVLTKRPLGEGSQVMAGAVVYAPLGKHCIVGTNAVVSHDCEIDDFVFIGPGAIICGYAKLRRGCFIGAGAVVTPRTEVPAGMLLKAGARMTKNRTVPAGSLVVPPQGTP